MVLRDDEVRPRAMGQPALGGGQLRALRGSIPLRRRRRYPEQWQWQWQYKLCRITNHGRQRR